MAHDNLVSSETFPYNLDILSPEVLESASSFFSLLAMQIIVEVSIPSVLSILPVFPVEVPVGTRLHASAALKTSNGVFAPPPKHTHTQKNTYGGSHDLNYMVLPLDKVWKVSCILQK